VVVSDDAHTQKKETKKKKCLLWPNHRYDDDERRDHADEDALDLHNPISSVLSLPKSCWEAYTYRGVIRHVLQYTVHEQRRPQVISTRWERKTTSVILQQVGI
jgi:hypothetical protein